MQTGQTRTGEQTERHERWHVFRLVLDIVDVADLCLRQGRVDRAEPFWIGLGEIVQTDTAAMKGRFAQGTDPGSLGPGRAVHRRSVA